MFATGSFRDAQLLPSQQPVLIYSIAPIDLSCHCQDRPFAAMARVAKADFPIASLFPLTWWVCVR